MELSEEDIYHFAKGLPGFETETDFAMVPVEGTAFHYLQSTTKPELSFLIADPFEFHSEYSFELADEDKEELKIEDQVAVYAIVTIHSEVVQSTMNLLAPLVLNPVTRMGKQVVLHQSGYETRHALWTDKAELMKGGD
ncbi:flagellar assembly protein FliW [Paenibacillus sp. P96]|uniref:Flagellar assembly factor FliW n=1 Tax=Paenibacillus zeirhizosphaerae TaxID=2987519 RepID=A0ABT9FV36_9BACL|nr:flagellar assembly protein FliW [Paenibacillus sp. P96]MDP4098598.1 flagellar assembly protein FliW [Paenibacillus sp. P96]